MELIIDIKDDRLSKLGILYQNDFGLSDINKRNNENWRTILASLRLALEREASLACDINEAKEILRRAREATAETKGHVDNLWHKLDIIFNSASCCPHNVCQEAANVAKHTLLKARTWPGPQTTSAR